MNALFDTAPYREMDYAAAADFVSELTNGAVTELPPGLPGANFCPIANALNDHYWASASAWDRKQFFSADPEERYEYVQVNGGSSDLFTVSPDRVLWPFTEGCELRKFDDGSGTDLDELALKAGYDFLDDDAEWVVPAVQVPDDCYANGGLVASFIQRFDRGEFPSLHLEV